MRVFVLLPYERTKVETAMPRVRQAVKDARTLMKGSQCWVTGTLPVGVTRAQLIEVLRLAGIEPLEIREA